MGAHPSEARTGMLEKDAAQSCPGDRRGMTDCTAEFVGGVPATCDCSPRDAELLWQVGDRPGGLDSTLSAPLPPPEQPAPSDSVSITGILGPRVTEAGLGLPASSARGQWKARCLKCMRVTKAMTCQVHKGQPVLNQLT